MAVITTRTTRKEASKHNTYVPVPDTKHQRILEVKRDLWMLTDFHTLLTAVYKECRRSLEYTDDDVVTEVTKEPMRKMLCSTSYLQTRKN